MNEAERRLIDLIHVSSYIGSFADPARQVLDIQYYAYSVDKVGLQLTNTSAPLSFPIIMDSDSEFVVTSLCGGAVISLPEIIEPANGNRVVEYSPALNVQITDDSSGKTFFNKPTPLPLIAGTGGFPYMFVNPRIIRPRSTIHVAASVSLDPLFEVVLEFSAFYFTLHGAKIYYAG